MTRVPTSQEKKYTLMAEMLYSGQIRRVAPTLTDTLAQLFMLVYDYKFVVLAREGQYFVTAPVGWMWIMPPGVTVLAFRQMQLNPRDKSFDTFAQALTYLDLCTT